MGVLDSEHYAFFNLVFDLDRPHIPFQCQMQIHFYFSVVEQLFIISLSNVTYKHAIVSTNHCDFCL